LATQNCPALADRQKLLSTTTDHTLSTVAPSPRADWKIEHRADGAVIVRVPSCDRLGRPLPEAVFAFEPGSPQYLYWREQFERRISRPC